LHLFFGLDGLGRVGGAEVVNLLKDPQHADDFGLQLAKDDLQDEQSDQIGPIFAYWAITYIHTCIHTYVWHFSENF
jgi:hypothetical protein